MTIGSSIVTALGGGSGVDMTALATNLATAQFQQRSERLLQKSETLERQISSASSLKNSLSLLAGALGDRVRTGDLAVTPEIANPSVATATAPPASSGSGSYSLEVTSLATTQVLTGPAMATADTVVGAGSLTFRFGATDAGSFTEDTSQAAVTVDIASGSTLEDIAQAINAKKSGVSAYVAQTEQGAQLMFKGAEGEQSGFVIEATETAGEEGLAALAWNPSAGGDPARLLDTSADAQFKVDGLAMTSASNDVGQVAPGLSLKLTGTNIGAPTKITFSDPAANVTSAMQDLVGALNEIVGDLQSATNPANGDLASDSGARALKRQLSGLAGQVVMPNAAADAPRTLSDLGLAIQRDGTFRLDAERLKSTLDRDPAGAAAMFTTGLYGVYATFDKLARSATSASNPGSLGGSIARYTKESKNVSEASAELTEKQEQLRSSLVARFAKADARVAASQSTLSFLQSQIDAWNSQRD